MSELWLIPIMLFNSLVFLYIFLPFSLLLVAIVPGRFKNSAILLSSLVFYAWSGVSLTMVLIGSVLLNYLTGLKIAQSASGKSRKMWFTVGVILNLLLLIVFKYTSFILYNVNVLTGLFGWNPLLVSDILLPLGLSFYTFKAISYLINVKRNETPAEKNLVDLALYISLFPQVMAGPIDRYKTLASQIHQRKMNMEQGASGIRRFALGLFKKVVIASPLAYVADRIFQGSSHELSIPLAWLGAISYTLQIYYDFSGYTDMAIGLGQMLGFRFTENFNYPYISRSIGEFWKRWHITLSTWLRDYLFLPLAYTVSGKLEKPSYFNIKTENIIYILATMITFLICGLWHGAAWNFIVWGLIQGVLISFERSRQWKWMNKKSRLISHVYFIFFLILSMVFFRSASTENALAYIAAMFGLDGNVVSWRKLLEFTDPEFLVTMFIAILGSTPFFTKLAGLPAKMAMQNDAQVNRIMIAGYHISTVIMVFLFLSLSTLYLVSKTNTPFIYFRF